MKVCILSMQRIDNYGSVLQAYGLKKQLENLGCDVEFMDVKKIQEDYILAPEKIYDFRSESDKRSYFLSKFDKYFLIRLKNKIVKHKKKEEFEKFRRNYLDIDKTSDNYNICVIGSDEVFSCLDAGWWGFTSQLFGNVPEADRVITYAASCGATRYEDLPDAVKNRIVGTFKNVEAISVRDENTKHFVQNMTDKPVISNLDPVLISDFEEEISNATIPKLPSRYCVIYSYSNRISRDEEVKAILSFCRDNGLTPITVFGSQYWCKTNIICSPFELLKVFKQAEFVITDTFHGTIFSAKYANRFAIMVRESNRNKLFDLVKRIGVEDHVLNNINDLNNIYKIEKNKEKIDCILIKERERSLNYLKEHVNEHGGEQN